MSVMCKDFHTSTRLTARLFDWKSRIQDIFYYNNFLTPSWNPDFCYWSKNMYATRYGFQISLSLSLSQ